MDEETTKMTTATYGGLRPAELEQLPFSRYERLIRIVNDMHKKEGAPDAY